VTTSAGDPRKYTKQLKAAGLTVFHVVPSLEAALKAIDAGVDGLVVEGGEGGGFRTPRRRDDGAAAARLPKVTVPVIAAGGICDGPSMAAAFALGAEGVQMGSAWCRPPSRRSRELEERDRRREETDTVFRTASAVPGCVRSARSAPSSSSARSTSASTCSAARWTSTSAATWKRRSRSAARSLAASTR
jgi:enoyl-[acyl-carrier protein] reductase II